MKRDSIFDWISLSRLRNIYGALIGVDNKLRYSSQLTFDNDLDIPDLGTVKSILGSGINSNIFTEADLVSDGFGGFTLPYALADGEVIIGIRIDPDTGDPIILTPSYDFVNNVITGFPNDDPQTIKIFATGQYSPPPPVSLPVFTLQPQTPLSVIQYNNFTLNSLATGATSYQWYKNGAAIPGATSASYTTNMSNSSVAGTYYVVATNSGGFTQSNNSAVSFDAGIVIWNRSNSKSIGGSATGRTISVDYGSGFEALGIDFILRVPSSTSTITIRQAGIDALALFDNGVFRTNLLGGSVDNTLASPFIELIIYNDN